MTIRHVVYGFFVALMLETVTFAFYYGDLLYLRRPVAEILSDSAGDFTRHAEGALERPKVTQHHLETIAAAARGFGLLDIEVRALQRRVAEDGGNRSLRLRLADALRRARQYDEAERIYVEVLASAGKEGS